MIGAKKQPHASAQGSIKQDYKKPQKPQLKHGRGSHNLFIGGSVWFVVPFSLTKVILRITGGVSNSFTP